MLCCKALVFFVLGWCCSMDLNGDWRRSLCSLFLYVQFLVRVICFNLYFGKIVQEFCVSFFFLMICLLFIKGLVTYDWKGLGGAGD